MTTPVEGFIQPDEALSLEKTRHAANEAMLAALSAYDGQDDGALRQTFQDFWEAYQLSKPENLAEFSVAAELDQIVREVAIVGHYPIELALALEGVYLAKRLDDEALQTLMLDYASTAHFYMGNYPQALEMRLEHLALCERTQDMESRATAFRNLGVIYSHMKRYADAIASYDKALPYALEKGDKLALAYLYNNYSVEYALLGGFTHALDYGKRSLALFEETERKVGQARAHGNIGKAYEGLGDTAAARHHYEKALEIIQNTSNTYGMVVGLQYLGGFLRRTGEPEKAIEHLQAALLMAQAGSIRKSIYECHEELALAYKALGKYAEALTHYEQFHTLKESVYDLETTQHLMSLDIHFRTRQSQHEIEREKQLRAQERAYFERLVQMKDQFLRSATLDLKNPLAVIMNSLYFLRQPDAKSDKSYHRMLDGIEKQIFLMRDLVADMLDLMRLETQVAINKHAHNLVTVLIFALDSLKPLAEQKHIMIIQPTPEDSPTVLCDIELLNKAVYALVANAIHYTNADGFIRVYLTQTAAEVTVHVQDSGIGIPEEDLPHLFLPFFRGKNPMQRNHTGAGLGLSIVKAIIMQHGGRVGVESQVGQGSHFYFTLPLPKAETT